MNYGRRPELDGSVTIRQTTLDNGIVSWEGVFLRKKRSKLTTTSPALVTRLDDTTLLISTPSVVNITGEKAVKVSKNILDQNQAYDVTIDN